MMYFAGKLPGNGQIFSHLFTLFISHVQGHHLSLFFVRGFQSTMAKKCLFAFHQVKTIKQG